MVEGKIYLLGKRDISNPPFIYIQVKKSPSPWGSELF
jgi:hypothetical protein